MSPDKISTQRLETAGPEREGSANQPGHMATALNAGGLPRVFASLMNVSLLDQNTDYVSVRFIQHSNNVGNRQVMICEEITDGHLAFGNRVRRGGRIGEDFVGHLEAFSLNMFRLCGHRFLLGFPGFPLPQARESPLRGAALWFEVQALAPTREEVPADSLGRYRKDWVMFQGCTGNRQNLASFGQVTSQLLLVRIGMTHGVLLRCGGRFLFDASVAVESLLNRR